MNKGDLLRVNRSRTGRRPCWITIEVTSVIQPRAILGRQIVTTPQGRHWKRERAFILSDRAGFEKVAA